jgi:transposase
MGSEIIEVVERRRRWPVEVRLRILDEAMRPGASVAAVADRHGVARGLVYQWLRQVREGRMPGLSLNKPEAVTTFAPVSVVPDGSESPWAKPIPTPLPPPAQPSIAAAPAPKRRNGSVEIRLANGRVLKVSESYRMQQSLLDARLRAAEKQERERNG